MSRKPLFSPDLCNIDTFLTLLGDRELERRGRHILLVADDGQPPKNYLARQLLGSLQPFLRASYEAAVQWKGKKAQWPYAHDPCQSWQIMAKDRAKSQCRCGDKTPRRLLEIRWANSNRFNRPDEQHRLESA